MNALLDRFPPLAACPHRQLGRFPTPVELAPGLARAAGLPEVWVKRDDLTSPLYGGNKVRKLEFVLADALDRSFRSVWTVGAIGSHHVLATALYGRQLGLDVEVCHFPQPVTAHVREICLAVAATGARLTLIGRWRLPFAVAHHRILGSWSPSGGGPYYIPGGGSAPLGCLGYVSAALELASQIEGGEIPCPRAVCVAVGTAGTLVGLVVGFLLARLDIQVVGIRVVDRVVANEQVIQRLAAKTLAWLRARGVDCPGRIPRGAYHLEHGQFGRGYGYPTEAGRRAVRIAEQEAGLLLENTYTGKALAGLLSVAEGGSKGRGPWLFWNTHNSRPVVELIPEGFSSGSLAPQYQALLAQESGE